VIALTHWPTLVNASVENGALHYLVHLVVFTVALLMWTPVCGPLPELRISLPAQMVYLFAMSIIPTIPAAWLTFAEGAVYSAYDQPDRLWGIGVTADQQAAGVLMKIGGGFFLWTLITISFFRWSYRQMEADRQGASPTEQELLTWDDVEREFERLGPAPADERAH
jgi:putative membrane protein